MDLDDLREGDLYVVRDGALVKLERPESDDKGLRIRLHADAAGAAYRARAVYARHVYHRASMHEIVSAIVYRHGDSLQIIAAMREWLGRPQS